MLASIPFHIGLLRADLGNGKKATNAHVLVYGAIEVHSMGAKGCIASNNHLATETGYSKSRVEDALSEMAHAGWIKVNMNDGKRISIVPLLTIGKPQEGGFLPVGRGVPAGRNIDNNRDNKYSVQGASARSDEEINKNTEPPLDFDGSPRTAEGGRDEGPAGDLTNQKESAPTTFALYWRVVRHYTLPTNGPQNIKKWASDLDKLLTPEVAKRYLTRLTERDLRVERETDQYAPQLSTAYSVYMQSAKIIQYYGRTYKPTVENQPDRADYEAMREAEAEEMRRQARGE